MLRKIPNCISLFLLKVATNQKYLFTFSFLCGAIFALLVHNYDSSTDSFTNSPVAQYDWAYERWLYSQGYSSRIVDPDVGRYKDRARNDSSFEYKIDPRTEAFYLYNSVSIHCLVFPSNEETVISVNKTWGRHCNKLSFYGDTFFSKKINQTMAPIRKLRAKSSFSLLCQSLQDIISGGEVRDWVLVTGDDTFVIPENLRYYVAPLNSSQPHYLGHAMKFWAQEYNWGPAGYALSLAAVRLLLTKFPSAEKCEAGGKYWKNADWYLGKHLASLGVKVRDTRDHAGKSRFNGYSFQKLLFPGGVSLFERYWRDSIYLSPDGPKCCSNHAVTFHGMLSMSKMHQLQYLFYHLRPFPDGGVLGNVPPPLLPANPFLTEEERLKNEALDKLFAGLLTTPKNMHLLFEHAFGDLQDVEHFKEEIKDIF